MAGLCLRTPSVAQDGGWFGFEVQVCPEIASMLRIACSKFPLPKTLLFLCPSLPRELSQLLFLAVVVLRAAYGHKRRSPPHQEVAPAVLSRRPINPR